MQPLPTFSRSATMPHDAPPDDAFTFIPGSASGALNSTASHLPRPPPHSAHSTSAAIATASNSSSSSAATTPLSAEPFPGHILLSCRVRPPQTSSWRAGTGLPERGSLPCVFVANTDRHVVLRNPVAGETVSFGFSRAFASAATDEDTNNADASSCAAGPNAAAVAPPLPVTALPSEQKTVFAQLVAPLLSLTYAGLNTSFFAFGPSGGGKTHLLRGAKGLVLRAVHDALQRAAEAKRRYEVTAVRVHMAAILFHSTGSVDLLAPTSTAPAQSGTGVAAGGSVLTQSGDAAVPMGGVADDSPHASLASLGSSFATLPSTLNTGATNPGADAAAAQQQRAPVFSLSFRDCTPLNARSNANPNTSTGVGPSPKNNVVSLPVSESENVTWSEVDSVRAAVSLLRQALLAQHAAESSVPASRAAGADNHRRGSISDAAAEASSAVNTRS